ncbi:23S rRNA (pseudouridine(1915)-N(3))-methyltransferase RlmH [candidate division KSB1 bacterium]|nr:23S rRNA (pseudouridine(1915)-N(3))-methyltransferase RlmH [candidate division KSB1 bacterium]
MHISVLCIGESKASYLKEGEKDYMNRLKHYTQIRIEQIRPVRHNKSKSEAQILKDESDLLRQKITVSSFIVTLDSKGKEFSSEMFAEKISNWQVQGKREILFVIGGPLGLHSTILKQADLIMSLSRMTFTHDMVRLVLLEQIYRAHTILRGEKYHK